MMGTNSEDKKKGFFLRNWKLISITIVIVLGLYFTLMLIFNTFNSNSQLGYIDFSKDEIQNYSGLIGAIISFLGVIFLIDTIKQQDKHFYDKIELDENEAKQELKYKLELLQVDLDTLIRDVEHCSENIDSFIGLEIAKPFEMHSLKRTSQKIFIRILDIDRISIFKAFQFHWTDKTNWIKDFNNLYSYIDFLADFYNDIYRIVDYHVKDIFDKKNKIRTDFLTLIAYCDEVFPIIQHEKNIPPQDQEKLMKLIYDLKIGYQNTIDSDRKNGTETNFGDLQILLNNFIEGYGLNQGIEQVAKLFKIYILCNELNIQIDHVRLEVTNFSKNLKIENDKIIVGTEEKKSVVSELKVLQDKFPSKTIL